MDYSKYDPSKTVIFLIAFLLGGTVLGPIGNAFINWADLSEESAIGFGGTMFSIVLGAIVIWWRINISTKQHIEAMSENNKHRVEEIIHNGYYDLHCAMIENAEFALRYEANDFRNFDLDIFKGKIMLILPVFASISHKVSANIFYFSNSIEELAIQEGDISNLRQEAIKHIEWGAENLTSEIAAILNRETHIELSLTKT